MNKIFILCIILGVSIFVGAKQTDYMKDQWFDVCVINKMEQNRPYKGRVINHLFFVMKDSKGRIFDREVSPRLYSTYKPGQCFKFELTNYMIKPDRTKDIYVFWFATLLPAILIGCGLTGLIMSGVHSDSRRDS